MAENEIRIACKTSDYLDLDQLVPFQGRFKVRAQKDIEVLAGYILDQCFSCPFFVWDKAGTYLILDGHGRYLALDYLRNKGYTIPKLPVVIIDAKDENDARLKVLELNNINGEFSKEVLLDYARELSLDFSNLHISGLDFSDVMGRFEPTLSPTISSDNVTEQDIASAQERLGEYRPPVDPHNYVEVTCPKCSFSFSVRID